MIFSKKNKREEIQESLSEEQELQKKVRQLDIKSKKIPSCPNCKHKIVGVANISKFVDCSKAFLNGADLSSIR